MLDLTRELSVLKGIPKWKWVKLKACVDALFERAEKEHALEINEDVLRERLVSSNEFYLNT